MTGPADDDDDDEDDNNDDDNDDDDGEVVDWFWYDLLFVEVLSLVGLLMTAPSTDCSGPSLCLKSLTLLSGDRCVGLTIQI